MAPLAFDFRGYVFESGVDALRSGFRRADQALADDISRLEAAKAGYLLSGVWEGERDEDGHLLWDREQLLDLDLEMAREALSDLRKAFALAAYHLWERSARQWTEFHDNGHEKLASLVIEQGIAIHPRLFAVRDLANALKHNSLKYGPALVASWPAVLPPGFTAPRWGDWYGAITLSDDQVHEVLDIVSRSGPTVMPER